MPTERERESLFKMLTKNVILFPDFRLSVVRDILQVNSQEVSSFTSPDLRLNGRHFPRKIQASNDGKTLSMCSMHYIQKEKSIII